MGAASVEVSIKHIYEKQYHSQDIEDARYKAQYHVSRSQPQSTPSTERAIVATTDPQTLPDTSTWYLVTNLPAPTECPGTEPPFPPASLEEVIRLYGLRMSVEMSPLAPGLSSLFYSHH